MNRVTMTNRLRNGLVLVALLAMGSAACADPFKVLVFTRTTGFRHTSIDEGAAAIELLGADYGFAVDQTADPAIFNDADLSQYAATVFLSTTEAAGAPLLNTDQRAAYERYIQDGRGFVGIHAASDRPADSWPWFSALVGGKFRTHPAIQFADVLVVDHDHPSTVHLDDVWRRRDEWYEFTNFSDEVELLLELDGESYNNSGGIDGFFPVAWRQHYDGGRSFYTSAGHTEASFADPVYLQHIAGGILWAAFEQGDYNRDGLLNAADYTVWRDSLGQEGLGLAADGDGDGAVTPADFQIWKNAYGAVTSPVSQPVPEPPGLGLVVALCGAVAIFGVGRRPLEKLARRSPSQ